MKFFDKIDNLPKEMQDNLKQIKAMDYDYERDRKLLKSLVKERERQQQSRKAVDNALGRKKDGSAQDLNQERQLDFCAIPIMDSIATTNRLVEQYIEKALIVILDRQPIYKKWMKDVKGIGHNIAAAIISTVDIYKADTVSKITQYAGMNPATNYKGKKSVPKSKYKKSMGEIVDELTPLKDGEVRYCVQTDELIRGDKPKEGFVLPYNKGLRVVLLGNLADSFIKSGSYYSNEFYRPYKYRLENSQKITNEIKKGGKVVEIPWCECTPNHRNMAARRFMIKAFIKDLYAAWRAIEGLPVRKPYEEEYLGRVHHISEDKSKRVTKDNSLIKNKKSLAAKGTKRKAKKLN